MKKLILAVLIFSIGGGNVYADQKLYSLEHADGSITIVAHVAESVDTLPEIISANGYGDVQAMEITEADLPMNDIEYRNFWYYNPAKNKIEVKKSKKDKYNADIATAEADRDVVLQKFIDAIPGLTMAEMEGIGIKKYVKVKKGK